MRTVRNFLIVFSSAFFINGNLIHANTEMSSLSGKCADLLSSKYTPFENDMAQSIADLAQRAINKGIVNLEDFAAALAHVNYDLNKVTNLDAQTASVLLFVEKNFSIADLSEQSRTQIGKLVLLKLLNNQAQNKIPETDLVWTRLGAARVLNALIRDRVILSRQFTDIVLGETVRELSIDQVYPGGGLYLNKDLEEWIRERNWDQKKEELKRIGFFVTQELKHQTNDFSDYIVLMNRQSTDKSAFDVFMNELVQPMIIDTLELALQTRHHRLFSVSDSLKVAGTNAMATGLMLAGTQAVILGDIPSVAGIATGGIICGAYLIWGDFYAHLKGWLAQRRLAINWKESTQQQCY